MKILRTFDLVYGTYRMVLQVAIPRLNFFHMIIWPFSIENDYLFAKLELKDENWIIITIQGYSGEN